MRAEHHTEIVVAAILAAVAAVSVAFLIVVIIIVVVLLAEEILLDITEIGIDLFDVVVELLEIGIDLIHGGVDLVDRTRHLAHKVDQRGDKLALSALFVVIETVCKPLDISTLFGNCHFRPFLSLSCAAACIRIAVTLFYAVKAAFVQFGKTGHRTQALSRYSPVLVSMRITSPWLMKSGTLTSAPVSTVAGLVEPVAVSPRTPGSVAVTSRVTNMGGSTANTFPL